MLVEEKVQYLDLKFYEVLPRKKNAKIVEFKQQIFRGRYVDIKDSLILWHGSDNQDVSAIIFSHIFSLLLNIKQWTAFLCACIIFKFSGSDLNSHQ